MKLGILGMVVMTALLTAGQSMAAVAQDGKAVYAKSCSSCHNVLPPKLGDKAAWEPRLTMGIDGLVASVLTGKGAMPANGGDTTLTEADIRAVVVYMLEQLK